MYIYLVFLLHILHEEIENKKLEKVTQKYVLLVSHQNSTEITGMCFQKMNLRSKICFLAHKMTILSD